MSGIGLFGELIEREVSGNGFFGGRRREMAGKQVARHVRQSGLSAASPGIGRTPTLLIFAGGGVRRKRRERKLPASQSPKSSRRFATQFADTAYWAARLESDRDGLVEVSFPMPENLTTWKIRGWTMSAGTRVGQGEAEIVTTKNLLLRMQAPRFFVETGRSRPLGQRAQSSENGQIGPRRARAGGQDRWPRWARRRARSKSQPAAKSRVDWRVKAVEHGEAVVRMQALTDEESDAMQMHFPVRVHGMLKTEAYAGAIRPDRESASFTITVPSKRRVNETLLEIRYSPTLAGAMVDALPYLVSYPHDTTDCTLYRFLPTVITQNILKRMHLDLAEIKKKRTNLNAQEIGDAAKRAAGWKRFEDNPVFDNAEVARMVKRGVRALTEMQLADGGWGWFSGWGEQSEPHMTALVVHGLQLAQQNGVAIVPGVLETGSRLAQTVPVAAGRAPQERQAGKAA